MSVQDCKMTGMPWISPYLCVEDVDQAIEFYQKAFNFILVGDVIKNEDGLSTHCEFTYKDCVMMMGLQGAWDKNVQSPNSSNVSSPIALYVYCEDVDKFCAHAKEHGAIVEQEPEDTFWGDRMCRLKDPNGYCWSFATHLGFEE